MALFPEGLEPHGGLPGQGAESCVPAVRDLCLWLTSSAVVQPFPFCPTRPCPILVKVLTHSGRLRFCKNRQT